MIAALNGTIHGQTVVLDHTIPQEYDGASVSVYIDVPSEMSKEERIAALKILSGRNGRIFPSDVNSYIRSIRDDNR